MDLRQNGADGRTHQSSGKDKTGPVWAGDKRRAFSAGLFPTCQLISGPILPIHPQHPWKETISLMFPAKCGQRFGKYIWPLKIMLLWLDQRGNQGGGGHVGSGEAVPHQKVLF